MAVSNLSPFQQGLSPSAFHRLARIGFLRSSICILLTQRGPSHVARLVMAIIVNAINGKTWGGLAADVIYKLLKRVKFKLYSASPVILKPYILWVIASLFGVFVGSIFGSCAPSGSMAVAGSMTISIAETAATSGISALEIKPQDGCDVAAVAGALPKGVAFLVSSRESSSGKSAEFLTCDILGSDHAVRTSYTNGLVRFSKLLQQLTESLRL